MYPLQIIDIINYISILFLKTGNCWQVKIIKKNQYAQIIKLGRIKPLYEQNVRKVKSHPIIIIISSSSSSFMRDAPIPGFYRSSIISTVRKL